MKGSDTFENNMCSKKRPVSGSEINCLGVSRYWRVGNKEGASQSRSKAPEEI